MKYIDKYKLFELAKALEERVWRNRILDFLTHYYFIFRKNKNKQQSDKGLGFHETGKTEYELPGLLITLIINSEFNRVGDLWNLRYPQLKADIDDASFFYNQYKKISNNRKQKWLNTLTPIEIKRIAEHRKEDLLKRKGYTVNDILDMYKNKQEVDPNTLPSKTSKKSYSGPSSSSEPSKTREQVRKERKNNPNWYEDEKRK